MFQPPKYIMTNRPTITKDNNYKQRLIDDNNADDAMIVAVAEWQ